MLPEHGHQNTGTRMDIGDSVPSDPAGANQCCNRLLNRLNAGEPRAVSKTLAALLDGNAGTPHDVTPRGFGVTLFQAELPLIEGNEGESRFVPEPAVHRFGISSQCEGLR